MSVDTEPPLPDNHGDDHRPDDPEGQLADMDVAVRLIGIAIVFALVEPQIPLNLGEYFVSILSVYGAYLLAKRGGPEPPPSGLLVA
ncbi:hypothetical protein ACH4GG_13015 [Streptomyces albidoflavus]|uniref:hypothetical protein n=1 Tax=Streptomyces TaxID=1883 RepID=UPI00101E4A7B|nr:MULTISPECIES: hypothetical protein [Streptomyces]MDI3342888.1 hypothetical protein [Streptomyces sp. AJ-1]RZE24669.1 hypothetical protein C0Q96_19150 [Streptomyces albidoflavus]